MNYLTLILLAVMPLVASAATSPVSLSVSGDEVCALGYPDPQHPEQSQVLCWSGYGDPKPIPESAGASQFAIGDKLGIIHLGYGCGITKGRVRCWGPWGDTLNGIFQDFQKATHISAGFSDVCAADAEKGLRCYGGDFPTTKISQDTPAISGVKFLSVGVHIACAVDLSSSISCWGGVKADQSAQFTKAELQPVLTRSEQSLKAPPRVGADVLSLSVGFAHACVLEGREVKCWGEDMGGETKTASLVGGPAAFLDAGFGRTCLVDPKGTKCVGERIQAGESLGAKTGFPVQLVSSKIANPSLETTCVLGDHAVACSGKIPLLAPHPLFAFRLDNLDVGLSRVAFYLYKDRARFLDRAAGFVRSYPVDASLGGRGRDARLLVLNVVDVFLSNLDVPNIRERILPQYQAVMKYIDAAVGISVLADIPASSASLRACVRLYLDGLTEARPLAGKEYQAVLDALVAEMASLYSKDDLEVKDFVPSLNRMHQAEAAISAIVGAARTHGLGVMLESIEEYLKTKAKGI